MKIVQIEWHPRLLVEIHPANWEYSVSTVPEQCKGFSAFYSIYGNHPVYGPDVLLYIGETKANELNSTRDISRRIKEHLSDRFWHHTDLSVSIGIPTRNLESNEILDLESILIAAHMPAMNRQGIDGARASAKKYLVQNTGFTRSLMPECSGHYWC